MHLEERETRNSKTITVKQLQKTRSSSTTSSPRLSIETLLLEHHSQVDDPEFSGYGSRKYAFQLPE